MSESETAPEGVPFDTLGLDERILQAVAVLGFKAATPIQAAAIKPLIDGKDVLGGARTGSGKTAAFGLPLVHHAREGGKDVKALVLAPTRELAIQVSEALGTFATKLPIRITCIYGGSPYPPQFRALKQGCSIVVGTPGRILDHLNKGTLDLSKIETVVLDEADEMLRMGFIDDVETLLAATPDTRQVVLFSATMPSAIQRVAKRYMNKPEVIQVESSALAVDHIHQRFIRVPQRHKLEALIRVLQGEERGTTLVFARTRKGCAEVADELGKRGLSVDALHGDMAQPARERVLGKLRSKRLGVLIATDVAARGIDVDHITHVINLDLPGGTEEYVHRIGRTGRAGREGKAISFVTPGEKRRLHFIQKDLKIRLEAMAVPSDAIIAKKQQVALNNVLEAARDTPNEQIAKWLEDLLAEDAWTVEAVALAALQKLADNSGVQMRTDVQADKAPHWARNQGDRNDRPPERERPLHELNEVEVFFPIGRNANVRPGDFVGALANETGISGGTIGRVTILDTKTFVGLPKEVADAILAKHSMLMIRGNEVTISLARPRQRGEGDQRGQDRGPRFNDRGARGDRGGRPGPGFPRGGENRRTPNKGRDTRWKPNRNHKVTR
ncbi:MAG: DEAD/DEAH box helicase [Rhodobacterales bacterium]|nr:DEAD/DEAH box helicase [Rhodobacterales bacterium]